MLIEQLATENSQLETLQMKIVGTQHRSVRATWRSALSAQSLLLSFAAHLVLLSVFVIVVRRPFQTELIAAGEGQGVGQGVIEVGVIEASQLSLAASRSVSFIGAGDSQVNNEVVETAEPKPANGAELLPSLDKERAKLKEKAAVTDRPTANQTEQLVTPQPLRGSSANTKVEMGRSSGSSAPAMSAGVGVSNGGNLGSTGVPGGSEYGRRIQMILGRHYNPPAMAAINDDGGVQYVIVQLRIGRDGRILSLVNGRLSPAYFKRRSATELINYAAERAIIAANPLPALPDGFLSGAQEAVAEIWFRYPK